LGLAGLGFGLTYAAYPVFERTSVQLPEFCGDFSNGAHPTASFLYELPGVGATTLITSDTQTALVAAIDFERAPFPSTVYLVQKSDGQILWSTGFANDIISASIESGTLYLYNDKIGYWIDTRTGLARNNVFTIDNYGGLSQTDRPVIGSVVSRGHVTFNSIAFNCFIDGPTGVVTPL
jgi:outer membrane protein assembly factor BamB